ncbi:MAG: DUF2784 domain-containing protein, partial [Methylococcaceae bacterium]
FICFVVLGGLLVLKFRWVVFLHIPAVIWGVMMEFRGWLCPLTQWENRFRGAANQNGYSGGFIDHYLIPIIYPNGLTDDIQTVLGGLVLVVNLLIYSFVVEKMISQELKS